MYNEICFTDCMMREVGPYVTIREGFERDPRLRGCFANGRLPTSEELRSAPCEGIFAEDDPFWENDWGAFVHQFPDVDGAAILKSPPSVGHHILYGDWMIVGVFMCVSLIYENEKKYPYSGQAGYLQELLVNGLQICFPHGDSPFPPEVLALLA